MHGKFLLVILMIGALAYPVAGAIGTINAGNTIYLGEGNLDISGAVGDYTKIAYFTGDHEQPDKMVSISSKTSFYVSPEVFSDQLGYWYCWNETLTRSTAPVAFYIDKPYLTIKVRDSTVDVDATNKWVYRGDTAEFSIETNMGVMTERGVTGVPVTIRVKSPDGNTYSGLVDAGGSVQSLSVSVPLSPYNPGIAWYTGDSRYPVGTYTVSVESEANYMKDNYPVEGATVSKPVTVLVQTRNPLITTATPTRAPETTTATAAATPKPTAPSATITTVLATTPAVTTAVETTMVPSTAATTAKPTTALPGFSSVCAILACGTVCALLLARRR